MECDILLVVFEVVFVLTFFKHFKFFVFTSLHELFWHRLNCLSFHLFSQLHFFVSEIFVCTLCSKQVFDSHLDVFLHANFIICKISLTVDNVLEPKHIILVFIARSLELDRVDEVALAVEDQESIKYLHQDVSILQKGG